MLELGGFSLRALACCHAYRPDHWESQFYPSIQDSRQHPQILSPGQAQEEFPSRHSGTCLSKHQALPLGLPSCSPHLQFIQARAHCFPSKEMPSHLCSIEPPLGASSHLPGSDSTIMLFQVPFHGLDPIYDTHCLDARVPAAPQSDDLLPCGVFLPPPQEGWGSCRSQAMVTPCLCARGSSRSLGVFQRSAWHRRSVLLWAASPLPGPSRVVCFRVVVLTKKEPLYY